MSESDNEEEEKLAINDFTHVEKDFEFKLQRL